MPTASVRTATDENPGVFSNERRPARRLVISGDQGARGRPAHLRETGQEARAAGTPTRKCNETVAYSRKGGPYSTRNAVTGSTRAARRAGIHAARHAVMPSARAAAMKAPGSVGVVSNKNEAISFV